ncbi:MAG TPA: hypothetical protein PLE04_11560 [Syntrophales bacterium]|nr:hypothetical protein [Syntrophales bacterium]
MSDMNVSKIRIKMGPIEIDYEGSERFLKEELPSLLVAVSKLYTEAGGCLDPKALPSSPPEAQSSPTSLPPLSTGTIAGRLKCESGSDLILAATAHLHLCLGQHSFTRQQILDQMKQAPTYYKAGYSSNLSKYLKVLVKSGKLNEVHRGTYALTPKTLREMRAEFDSREFAEGSAQ